MYPGRLPGGGGKEAKSLFTRKDEGGWDLMYLRAVGRRWR